MHKNRMVVSILTIWFAIVNCTMPLNPAMPQTGETQIVGASATLRSTPSMSSTTANTPPPVATDVSITSTLTPIVPTLSLEPTTTFTASPTSCTPTMVANSPSNVRSGPGTVYPILGALPQSSNAPISGKNADGTWWYIEFAGGHGWVSGSIVSASCLPDTLAIIAAPPTPLPPSGTCRDGFVFRLARPSDKVCVPPASKIQSDADNAAADSRKIINVYGTDACAEGFVWREAFADDHVCVTTAIRSQTASDNASAAGRWVVGAYGPHTCIAGFVWRESRAGDDVCVEASVRTQAQSDNAAASSRLATSISGPDTCISGYDWRNAFSGDHVCVTPTIRSQVAADNAAAASHTWP